MISGPAYISFSFGRTSAFMLWRLLEEGIDEDVHVIFANTGKEREESLVFGCAVGERWGVRVRWLERAPNADVHEVGFDTASRRGEPFKRLISERGYLPHPGAPYCSTELKARVCRAFMLMQGHDEWDAYVGLRADEGRRVARLRGRKVEGGHVIMPLAEEGLTLADVERFWATQPFDLKLHPHEGNCDLCWKKSAAKIGGMIDVEPSRATWWAEQERRTRTLWRLDRPSYAAMQDASRRQVRLPLVDDGGEPCGVCA